MKGKEADSHPVCPRDLKVPDVIPLGFSFINVPHADTAILFGAGFIWPVAETFILQRENINSIKEQGNHSLFRTMPRATLSASALPPPPSAIWG